MNLFWKKIAGILQSTAAFERKIETARINIGTDTSEGTFDDVQDVQKLENLINSAEFCEKKELYRMRKYKDTDENRIMRQYEKLQNDPNIRLYYKTKYSDLLNEYINFKVNSDSLSLKGLSIQEISEKIRKLKAFEQSQEYKNYTQYHDSLFVREFEELKKKTSDPGFQQSNMFWANPERWETTYEYQMEQRYLELIGKKRIPLHKRNRITFFQRYSSLNLLFSERFDWNRLEESRWSAGFHSNNKFLVGNYSYFNEQQANNGGRNISISEGVLTLHTVQLPCRSLAWDEQKGFVEKEFGYTSDVIQTSRTFRQKYGVFCAKVRCSGTIHHAVWLSSSRKLPHINLFHFDGKDITMGNATQHKMDGVTIKGISESQFYIYTLEWTPRALVWYINNVEVYRTSDNIPHEALCWGINSFIPNKMEPSDGKLEVDWIKVFAVREWKKK